MQVASAHVGNRAYNRAPAHPPRQPTGRGRRERSARRCPARRRPSARDEPEHVRRVSTPSTHCSTIRMGLAVVEGEWLPPAAPVVYSHCVLREYRKRTHRLPWRLFAFGLQFGVLQRHAAVAVYNSVCCSATQPLRSSQSHWQQTLFANEAHASVSTAPNQRRHPPQQPTWQAIRTEHLVAAVAAHHVATRRHVALRLPPRAVGFK